MAHADLVRSVSFVTTSTPAVLVPPAAKTMAVQFPTLASGTVSIEVSIDGVNYVPLNGMSGDDTEAYAWLASTGDFAVFIVVLGFHSVKFVSTVSQAAADPLSVRFVQDKAAV